MGFWGGESHTLSWRKNAGAMLPLAAVSSVDAEVLLAAVAPAYRERWEARWRMKPQLQTVTGLTTGMRMVASISPLAGFPLTGFPLTRFPLAGFPFSVTALYRADCCRFPLTDTRKKNAPHDVS